MDYFIFNSGRCILSCDDLLILSSKNTKNFILKNLVIKICAFMILITLFTGCHQQNKLYSFETKKIDDQVILI